MHQASISVQICQPKDRVRVELDGVGDFIGKQHQDVIKLTLAVGIMYKHNMRQTMLKWLYCPGHACVCGNERFDWLASRATPGRTPRLSKADIILFINDYLLHGNIQTDDYMQLQLMES